MKELKEPLVRIFDDPPQLAEFTAMEFERAVSQSAAEARNFSVALSGGSTPALFFQHLAAKRVDWACVQLYWGDERCVPPDHRDSNYLMTRRMLLDKIDIPDENVHRIRGEDAPDEESVRYAGEIRRTLSPGEGLVPGFDWIILGLGTDGHTASIFPGFELRADPHNVCAVATHPETGQERITLTLPVINNARRVTFMAAGLSKAPVVEAILSRRERYLDFPASRVNPRRGSLEWLLDHDASWEFAISD
jgi:6-phosphogluconolactonase